MKPVLKHRGFHEVSPSTAIGDLRFRALLGADAWNALPGAVRERFSERVGNGDSVVYVGAVHRVRITRLGRLWCELARLIGGPLPLVDEVGAAAVVTVTEDARSGGQVWTRMYARRTGFPQVIHSVKRFEGPTGLEEYVGRGIGMTLNVCVEHGTLKFRSAGYFVQLGKWRMALPAWLTPGALTVTHTDLGDGRFEFALDVAHPRLGPIIHQSAIFKDA
jgi:hypothetical protein